MKRKVAALGIVALFGVVGIAHASGDVQAGKALAQKDSCAGCHGANGQGTGAAPALAGLGEAKFVQDMKDFKSGKIANPTMKMMAGKVNDKDVANLAAYYGSLKK